MNRPFTLLNAQIPLFAGLWAVAGLLALAMSSCSLTAEQRTGLEGLLEAQDTVIQRYLEERTIGAFKTEDGIYYTVDARGNGPASDPDLVNDITYHYRLINGISIDTAENYSFIPNVASLMPAFTDMVPRMQVGDTYTMYIPSPFALGAQPFEINEQTVPANSILITTITLNEVRTITEQRDFELEGMLDFMEMEGVISDARLLDSTMYHVELIPGDGGPTIDSLDRVTIAYTGTFLDGQAFDSSEEFTFVVEGEGLSLIEGFDIGIQAMRFQEEAFILIPSWVGYGDTGTADRLIPPFATLVFRIQVNELLRNDISDL